MVIVTREISGTGERFILNGMCIEQMELTMLCWLIALAHTIEPTGVYKQLKLHNPPHAHRLQSSDRMCPNACEILIILVSKIGSYANVLTRLTNYNRCCTSTFPPPVSNALTPWVPNIPNCHRNSWQLPNHCEGPIFMMVWQPFCWGADFELITENERNHCIKLERVD